MTSLLPSAADQEGSLLTLAGGGRNLNHPERFRTGADQLRRKKINLVDEKSTNANSITPARSSAGLLHPTSSAPTSSHLRPSNRLAHRKPLLLSLPGPTTTGRQVLGLGRSERQLMVREDDQIYGPPSPLYTTSSSITSNNHHHHRSSSPSGALLRSDSYSPSTPGSSNRNTSSSIDSDSADELFLSEVYPPIRTRFYPFFNESLKSPIGMGKGQPIIAPHLVHQTSSSAPTTAAATATNSPSSYFSLTNSWTRIARTLSGPPYHLPELPDSLSYPADQASLDSLQRALSTYNLALPDSVRQHFLVHDGQDVFSHSASGSHSCSSNAGIVWGLWLMSCEEVEAEWGFWRRLDGGHMPGDAFTATDFASHPHPHSSSVSSDPDHHHHHRPDQNFNHRMSSCPAGWVNQVYSHPGWLPLLSDRVGNYIGVDLSPPHPDEEDGIHLNNLATTPLSSHSSELALSRFGPDSDHNRYPNHPYLRGGGQGSARPEAGQVIAFGREIDEKVVLWRGNGNEGWANWLASFADDLEEGKFVSLVGSKTRRKRHPESHDHSGTGWRTKSDEERGDYSLEADDEEEDQEDGLGEVGYFNDGGYSNGVDDEDFHGWKLASDYRGMSVIDALCARSKKRWAEIGLYASSPQGQMENQSSLSLELKLKLPQPSSYPHFQDSSPVSGSAGPTSPPSAGTSRLSKTEEPSNPPTPIAFVTPPSPRLQHADPSLPSSEIIAPKSSSQAKEGSFTKNPPRLAPQAKQRALPNQRPRRPPPPAPMMIDLPTLDSLMLEDRALEDEDYEPGNRDHSNCNSEAPSPNPNSSLVSRLSNLVGKRMSEEMNRDSGRNSQEVVIGMQRISLDNKSSRRGSDD